MNMKPFALTVALSLAWFGSTARAQNPTENPPTVPADSAPKTPPKAAHKSETKAPTKGATKTAKKDEPKTEEAKPLTPGPAVVKVKNLNVRGKAAINSEVVTHLQRGDHIQVIEEVTLKNPKTDEPAKWAKIALPTNAPVWISAHFIDANNKTVAPNKLNLRSGPGENYSVIGTLTKGTAVKEIETKGDWIRIEPPANSFAFVAAHMIANEAAPPVAVALVTPPKPPPTVAVTPPPAVATPAVAVNPPPVTTDPVTPPPVTTVATPPVTVAPTTPPVVVAPPITTPPVTPEQNHATPTIASIIIKPSTEPTPFTGAVAPEVDEDVKRVVTREGIVKRSVSIQAPTYFVLENLSNGKTINYLHSTNLVLRDFYGKRVVVSGEEELDERWPHTPVITVDKVEPVKYY